MSSHLIWKRVQFCAVVLAVAGVTSCSVFSSGKKGPGSASPTATPTPAPAAAAEGPALAPLTGIARQPLVAQVDRLIEAMKFMGSPLGDDEKAELKRAKDLTDDAAAIAAIQAVLDKHVLVVVNINPESRVKAARGPARAELMQQGWRAFLVKVVNESGVTAPLAVTSPNTGRPYDERPNKLTPAIQASRWMDVSMFDARPLSPGLSGLALEYRVMHIYSQDAGEHEGQLAFNVGQGTQDIGFRADVDILFRAVPCVEVTLRVKDTDGTPTRGAFVFTDPTGCVYPVTWKRLAPDFFFHDQVYRADGETVLLPPGHFKIRYGRGPEYLSKAIEVDIPNTPKTELAFKLERWINPTAMGYVSGDHHIHAAGCAHYMSPSIGVGAADMMRQIEGEGLDVGCVLTWGPGWYHQKQNFTGKEDLISTAENVLRYDVEVSGFPSDHCGHLALLRLKEDDYYGTDEKSQWPSWTLPILKWAKAQGSITGVAHTGWGLEVFPESNIPNYVIPPMNGIGAQEYLVDVCYDAVDFLSMVDTPPVYELNMWYNAMNCGWRTKISGETDFPCIYGERVGLGRSYVKSKPGKIDFEDWVQGIKAGRAYVSDGFSHLMNFQVNGIEPGGKEAGVLALGAPGRVKVTADVAAYLESNLEFVPPYGRADLTRPASEVPFNDNREIPYWHIQRARVGARNVPVEVIVNGVPVARREILADGKMQKVEFDVKLDRSSWVALRILPSAHTNVVYAEIGGKPIRSSRRSAQWCLDTVNKCWKEKSPHIREEERDAAEKAWNDACAVYQKIIAESYDDHDKQSK